MKSVKSKLFISFTSTIFVILLFLSIISIYFFNLNKETRTLELLDATYTQMEDILEDDESLKIKDLDKYIDLRNQFLIIFKEDSIAFTNQSRFKTQEILEQIKYEDEHEDDSKKYEDRKEQLDKKYEDYYDEGFIEIDDYVLTINSFEKDGEYYEAYLGIDEKYLEQSLDDIYGTIIVLNLVIFFLLTFLGYLLINKTINPLKLILNELEHLQSSDDLSKRLKENKTKDEFEELIISFNKMLENVENSVENIKQFSSDASHELKTPLTIIQGEIELIKNKEASKEELEAVINKVDKEQKKLQEIIKNFLLLSRLEKEVQSNKRASLDKVLFEAVELNLDFIEKKNLELILEIEEDLNVNFDEKYLSIVVNNLLTNAVKYTQEGHIKILAKKQNKNILLEINDSGIGISKEDQNKIYERFYRVDKARTSMKDGIGLGLAIVKKICERFESSIKVKSEINKGSTFSIKFKA
ncbi:sensor histidine kinase [Poseidonibacter lekithochrous]|uniref:sensor histidine kinase n=1 Tax=Poseidonibacter lekithochrous TaxID=1904463 RepID=UPI000D348B6B|nr:HAMP domain-containing sensor histidine kinase [Poseidonibacter lekithochrous]